MDKYIRYRQKVAVVEYYEIEILEREITTLQS